MNLLASPFEGSPENLYEGLSPSPIQGVSPDLLNDPFARAHPVSFGGLGAIENQSFSSQAPSFSIAEIGSSEPFSEVFVEGLETSKSIAIETEFGTEIISLETTDAIAGEMEVAGEFFASGESEIRISETIDPLTGEWEFDRENLRSEVAIAGETEVNEAIETSEGVNSVASEVEIREEIGTEAFSSGTFRVGASGRVGVEFATDGGSFEGELGVFLLEGLETYAPGSKDFIREAVRRVLSGTQGHVIISDREDAAKFASGESGVRNGGEYRGVREFELPAGAAFGVVLVPNGRASEVFENPAIAGNKAPLFSLATEAEGDRLAFGQIADLNGEGYVFAIEDLWVGRSDLDYNDVIFRLTGATGDAPHLADVISSEKDWRDSPRGREVLEHVSDRNNSGEPTPPPIEPPIETPNPPIEPPPIDPPNPPIEPPIDPPIASPQPLVGFIGDRVAIENPDLDGDRIRLGYDFLDDDSDPTVAPEDDEGNGTFLAGVVGATQENALGIDGINDEAPLWVGAADATTWAASLQEFIRDLANSGQQNGVVFLGFPFVDAEGNPRERLTVAEREAIATARQQGIVLVVPAGDSDGTPSVLAQASQEFDNILTVGAADVLTGDRAGYANYGLGLDLLADGGTLENPVSSIAGDGVGAGVGTAIAAAQVGGALSQVWAENPALNYRQAIATIESSATDLGVPGVDAETGAGLLNLEAALVVARETTGEPLNPQPIAIPDGDGVATPIAIELGALLGESSVLENGTVRQFFETGVELDGIAVGGELYRAYDRHGGWDGPLGLPTGVAQDRGNGFIEQEFEGGHIVDGGNGAIAYLVPEVGENALLDELPPTPYEPDRLLVKVVETATEAEIQELVAAVGARDAERLVKVEGAIDTDLEQWMVFEFEPGSDVRQLRQFLLKDVLVEAAELDYQLQLQWTPNDAEFGKQWSLENIGAPEAWDIERGSRDVTVAVIDTGIDYNHEDLAANIWRNAGEVAGNGIDDDGNGYVDDVRGWNFYNNSNDPKDAIDHGTHVAGIVGAVGNNDIGVSGVSPEVGLMALRFTNDAGLGSTGAAVKAIHYAVENGADIINASWGRYDFFPPAALYDAVSYANDADILFVAAAGNDGLDNDFPFYRSYPASFNLPNVISVAATNGEDGLWKRSNYGANSVDLGAPGVGIYSTLPGNRYGLRKGTSMAVPQVAGAAALLLAANPALSSAEVKQTILDAVEVIPSLENQVLTGGRLNISTLIEPPEVVGTSFVVINTKDDGSGSLRSAIEMANALPGKDTILFDIPTSDSGYNPENNVFSIFTLNTLNIFDPVILNGATQKEYVDRPVIAIDGSQGLQYLLLRVGNNNLIANLLLKSSKGSGILINDNNTILGNSISDNSVSGIYAYSGSSNKILENTIFSNVHDGIFFHGDSDENTVSENDISGNGGDGVFFHGDSDENKVSENDISGNGGNGVFFHVYSDENTVSKNDISGNGEYGIVFHGYSNENTVSKNDISSNGGDGVFFHGYSNENTVSKNDISSNGGDGVFFHAHSNENTVSKNDISSNGGDGVFFHGDSDGNVISENSIFNNGKNGIFSNRPDGLFSGPDSDGKRISLNPISNNGNGIFFHADSDGNTVSGNSIFNNNGDGILLSSYSDGNMISDNMVFDNLYGSVLVNNRTSDNIISGNTVSNFIENYGNNVIMDNYFI